MLYISYLYIVYVSIVSRIYLRCSKRCVSDAMFDVVAFTVGGVGAVAAVAEAAVPGTRGFETPLNEGFAESGFGFCMVAEGVVPAIPLGSVLAVLVNDLGRGATLFLLALAAALDAVDVAVAVAVEELTALVVDAGAGLKLENAREGEMSERVGATRATGALMDPVVRRYVGAAAAASFSAMTLLAGFGGAGRCGLRGIGGSCSSAWPD